MKKLLLTAVLAVIACLVFNALAESMSRPIPIFGTFAVLTLSHNDGIAFGVNLPSPLQELLIGVALLLVLFFARHAKDPLSQIAFGLIIGGAAANLIDRAIDGRVTDYVAIGTFPIFNAADACITIGAGLLILEGWKTRKKA